MDCMIVSNNMGSAPAVTDLTSPSSGSSPRFNSPEGLSFERQTLQVGRYRILSELGRGGMSNVYLAVASGPGGVNKLVVLKALLPDLATEGYALSMFMDEARLAAQLNHPNVVQTYEVGTEGDRHVIVMEYLEGQSLSAAMRRAAHEGGGMPLALQLRIIINALEGLHYAHELNGYEGAPLQLVHRDISPQNVFVTYDGQVKVLDFGIAKATSASTHTAAGVMKGKIAYMAPEQIIGGNVDRRADLYSVGCMLWASATGQKLWKDTPDVQIMRRAISGDVPTPQSVNPDCDDELNRIVVKALAREPADRYSTALELQHDLDVYVERFGAAGKQKEIARYISALFADTRAQLKALVERQLGLIQADNSSVSRERPRPAPGSTTLGGATSESVHTMLAEALPAGAPRKRGWLTGVALLALLGLAGAAFFGWGRRGAETQVLTTAPEKPVATTGAVVEPATSPKRVSIGLQATPPEAKLFLDGEALPTNPSTKLLTVDGKAHVLRAEAPGFANASTEFSPSQDTTVELLLSSLGTAERTEHPARSTGTGSGHYVGRVGRPVAGAAAPPTAPPVTTPTVAPPSAVTAAPKPNCDSPIFLDKDGIRRVRPECR